jgi:hypothetical protein
MYKLSEIMQVLKLNEPATRKLLIDVGANLAELDQDPSEAVSREDVIALWHDRADQREGRLLAQLLKPDYCTQNNGDCETCSLVSYGRDCMNNPIRRTA